ncbi:unnamed protein product [Paramecium octaurelia]|uniref:Uncharacterized protein n=1 Tax=Paramecium octaurelia TaxID=43137 RepID=A0A8S1Y8I0_PAROT|nr:unnamed protein product [Paramecium octaurelia]
MQQYPIRSYSKHQNQLQEHSTRYTPNKFTDWHKKYEPKHKLDCQPDLYFHAQSIINQRQFQVRERRFSQPDYPQQKLSQYSSEPSNKENRPQFQTKFDFKNIDHILQNRLNQRL